MMKTLCDFFVIVLWILGMGCFGYLAYIGQWLFAVVDLGLMILSFERVKKSYKQLGNIP